MINKYIYIFVSQLHISFFVKIENIKIIKRKLHDLSSWIYLCDII
jgi:hypothetical protein